MFKLIPKSLLFLLLLGLGMRLFFSVQIYSGDVNNHISWGKDSLVNGFAGIYERDFWPDYGTMTPTYPPIPIFLFTVFHGLYDWVYKTSWYLNVTEPLFPSNFIFFLEDQDTLPAFLKIPAIFADLGIAYVVYLFVTRLLPRQTGPVGSSSRPTSSPSAGAQDAVTRRDSLRSRHPSLPIIAASLVLFNPAFFYNSAYWGQIEAIPLFFALSAFYLLLYSRRFVLACVVFTLALLSKQSSIVFIPIFALVFLMKFGAIRGIRAIGVSLSVFWISFLPFFKSGNIFLFPFITYWNKIQTGSGSDYIVDHAFNFWSLVVGLGKVPDHNLFLLGFSFKTWGYALFLLIIALALYKIYQSKAGEMSVLTGNFLVASSAFLFLTRMHERYLEQALPFLLLVCLIAKKKNYVNFKILFAFLFLSLFHFSNLYHNWWAPRVDWAVSLLSAKTTVDLAILAVLIVFSFLLLKYIKGDNFEENN